MRCAPSIPVGRASVAGYCDCCNAGTVCAFAVDQEGPLHQKTRRPREFGFCHGAVHSDSRKPSFTIEHCEFRICCGTVFCDSRKPGFISRLCGCCHACTAMCAHGTSEASACSSTARLLQSGSQAGSARRAAAAGPSPCSPETGCGGHVERRRAAGAPRQHCVLRVRRQRTLAAVDINCYEQGLMSENREIGAHCLFLFLFISLSSHMSLSFQLSLFSHLSLSSAQMSLALLSLSSHLSLFSSRLFSMWLMLRVVVWCSVSSV